MTSLTNTGVKLVIINIHVIPSICKHTQTDIRKKTQLLYTNCLLFTTTNIEYPIALLGTDKDRQMSDQALRMITIIGTTYRPCP